MTQTEKVQELRHSIVELINTSNVNLPEIAASLAYVIIDAGANVLQLNEIITEAQVNILRDRHKEKPGLASALVLQGIRMLQWLDTENILHTTKIMEHEQHGKTT